jgi:hypothetical protein
MAPHVGGPEGRGGGGGGGGRKRTEAGAKEKLEPKLLTPAAPFGRLRSEDGEIGRLHSRHVTRIGQPGYCCPKVVRSTLGSSHVQMLYY